MRNTLVSIIMSVYNVNDDFLKESIESILGQSYDNFEFLIFDDATCETNRRILEKYAKIDKRIVLFTNEENKGLTANLICGVQQAKGRYICRQDADDISLKERIDQEYQFLEKNTEVAMVATNMWIKDGNKISKKYKYIQNYKYIRTKLFFENCIMHSSIMMRTDVLRNYNLNYNILFKKAQDYDLWIRISEYGKIVVLNNRLCILRVHKDQITKRNELEQKNYYLRTAVSQLKNIGISSTQANIVLHKRFLTLDTYELKRTFKWSVKLLISRKPQDMWSIYFNINVIKQIIKMVVKKVVRG